MARRDRVPSPVKACVAVRASYEIRLRRDSDLVTASGFSMILSTKSEACPRGLALNQVQQIVQCSCRQTADRDTPGQNRERDVLGGKP
jgi:hypothetical protein